MLTRAQLRAAVDDARRDLLLADADPLAIPAEEVRLCRAIVDLADEVERLRREHEPEAEATTGLCPPSAVRAEPVPPLVEPPVEWSNAGAGAFKLVDTRR